MCVVWCKIVLIGTSMLFVKYENMYMNVKDSQGSSREMFCCDLVGFL